MNRVSEELCETVRAARVRWKKRTFVLVLVDLSCSFAMTLTAFAAPSDSRAR